MRKLVIELKEKFAERQITAFASMKGWQPTVPNPKRARSGEPVVIDNPNTAEMFLKDVFIKEFNNAIITHEARQYASDSERIRREELEEELAKG